MPVNCSQCEKLFSTQFNLNKHLRVVHNKEPQIIENALETKYFCVDCAVYFKFNDELRKHLENKHDFKNEQEELEFESSSAFNQWLSQEESKNNLQYVQNAGKKRSAYDFQKIYYECRRSYRKEKYIADENRKRSQQSQGSCKMSKSCTSQIILKKNTNTDKCFVTYYKSHYLHNKNEIEHLQIPKKDKETIASKLIIGIPPKQILHSTRKSISSDLKRIDLLLMKDIQNIKRAYKIDVKDGCRHSDDATSVDLWVNECLSSDSNPVLFYKRQGQKLVNFEDKDFCLVFMNVVQKKILTDFGEKIITIDGTHGLNGYDFELTTLLTLDENREGFPVAFMFSNRKDTAIYITFFNEIRNAVGKINATIFMSDITDTYFNAWCITMGPPEKRLLCSWHVDRAWQSNLTKISNAEKRSWVYKTLKFLQYLLNINVFEQKFSEFLSSMLIEESTKQFAEYIQKYYLPIRSQWAYCYRTGCGINTNMHIESFHKAIKYNYLEGKKIKRLDKTIHQLMTFIHDKTVNRIIYLKKGKYLKNEIVARHRQAITSNLNIVEDEPNSWSVSNSDASEWYNVKKLSDSVCCSIKCSFCNICIHTYTCTCTDFIIKTTICKHIHFFVLNTNINLPNNSKINDHSGKTKKVSELVELMNDDSKNQHQIKETIKTNFAKILNNIDNLNEGQLATILQHSNTCLLLSSLPNENTEEETHFQLTNSTKNEPVNKNIIKQKSFFSTKKKKVVKKSLSKASKKEKKILNEFVNNAAVISDAPENDHQYSITSEN